jgi:hypothetical protein
MDFLAGLMPGEREMAFGNARKQFETLRKPFRGPRKAILEPQKATFEPPKSHFEKCEFLPFRQDLYSLIYVLASNIKQNALRQSSRAGRDIHCYCCFHLPPSAASSSNTITSALSLRCQRVLQLFTGASATLPFRR